MKRTLSFADMTCLHKKAEPKVRKTQSCTAALGIGMDNLQHLTIINDGIDEYDLCVNFDDHVGDSLISPLYDFGVSTETAFTTKDLTAMLHAMKTCETLPTRATSSKLPPG